MSINGLSKSKTSFDKLKYKFHNFLINPQNQDRLYGFGSKLIGLDGGDAARKTWEDLHKPEKIQQISITRFRSLFNAINIGYEDKKIKEKLEEKIKLEEFNQFKIDESFRKGEIYFSEMLNFKDVWSLLTNWQVEQEEEYVKFKVKLEKNLILQKEDINKYYFNYKSSQSLAKIVEPELLEEFNEEIRLIFQHFDEFFNVENIRIQNIQGQLIYKKHISKLLMEENILKNSIENLFKKKIKIFIGQDRVFNHSIVLDNNNNSFADISIPMHTFWGLQIRRDDKLEPSFYNYHENENGEEKIINKTLDRINFLKTLNK